METVFVLTVMYLTTSDRKERRSRTWGWFPNLTTAETAVMGNHGDMYEAGYYNHAVLEEMVWGPCATAKSEHWYSATLVPEGMSYDVARIEKPQALRGLVSFGMG